MLDHNKECVIVKQNSKVQTVIKNKKNKKCGIHLYSPLLLPYLQINSIKTTREYIKECAFDQLTV